ncbi:MAG: phosphatidylglycerophosphatase A family protein [Candidatus Binatia bacterium]
MHKSVTVLVAGGGAGFVPYFPGTAGTAVAVPLSLALNAVAARAFPLGLLLLCCFVVMAAWLCRKGDEIFAEKDSPKIVVDEIAGFLLANFLSPPEFKTVAVAFLLFRFFDIMKVFPASWAETLENGVIMDDLIAGAYTFAALRALLYWGVL